MTNPIRFLGISLAIIESPSPEIISSPTLCKPYDIINQYGETIPFSLENLELNDSSKKETEQNTIPIENLYGIENLLPNFL